MHGLFPQSEEFMFWDPEHIEEYSEWQSFDECLEKEVNLSIELTPELKYSTSEKRAKFDIISSKEYQ